MDWIFLIIAGVFEVAFATFLKLSEEFTKPLFTVLFFGSAITSFYFLTKGMQSIPIGTAYAVWTGIGAAGTLIVGILFFKEPATVARIALLCAVIGSIVGLKFVAPGE